MLAAAAFLSAFVPLPTVKLTSAEDLSAGTPKKSRYGLLIDMTALYVPAAMASGFSLSFGWKIVLIGPFQPAC